LTLADTHDAPPDSPRRLTPDTSYNAGVEAVEQREDEGGRVLRP
jgi:hypothetical protein